MQCIDTNDITVSTIAMVYQYNGLHQRECGWLSFLVYRLYPRYQFSVKTLKLFKGPLKVEDWLWLLRVG